ARARERLVLREESVAGVDRVGAHTLRGVEYAFLVQVALARRPGADGVRLVGHQHVQRGAVGLAEDGDARAAGLAHRADHAHGDLAAVRDQDALQARHQPSSTTHATPSPASCESVRCERVAPSAVKRSSATPVSFSSGTRPPGCTTSICVQPTPPAMPVPSALLVASLAAKRAARCGSGSLNPRQYASSAGVNSRFSMRSPNRRSDSEMRSTLHTSMPMPRTGTSRSGEWPLGPKGANLGRPSPRGKSRGRYSPSSIPSL